MGKPVTRTLRAAAAVATFMTMSVAAWGQLPNRPHSSTPAAEPAPTGSAIPELDSVGRAVAIQARPDQVGYFHEAIESTDVALQQSRELQRLGPDAGNIPTTNLKSLQLRDALDNVEHYNGRFLASFSKTQESELKKLTKKLRKSYPKVSKEARDVSQLLEPGAVVPARLRSAAANLEKALSDFRTDQIRLGREMGIQSR
jgi:hypothetical protein